MQVRIASLPEKLLVGMHSTTSQAEDNTRALWQGFMPRRGEVAHRVGVDVISVQQFDGALKPEDFTATTEWEKWAAVEVTQLEAIPEGMEVLVLKPGKYGVFLHRGPASAFPRTMQFIFGEWLPQSEYELDNRERFEVLKPDYRPDDPDAEEEVWIPIV